MIIVIRTLYFSMVSFFVALLDIRNRAEAKRKEDSIKADLAAEGKPTEGVHVEPGSVDWLYTDTGGPVYIENKENQVSDY